MAIMNFVPVDEGFCDIRKLSLSGDEGDRSSSDDEKCGHECKMDLEFSSAEHALCNSLTERCVVQGLAQGSKV